MRFREAVERTPSIKAHFCEGLQAVSNVDRNRLHCSTPRKLRGSVNLDTALEAAHPQDPRWDYGIGISRNSVKDFVVWVEVHPASSRHIDEVLRKLDWLRRWLEADAPDLRRLRGEFRWVTTGSVAFRRGSQEERRIAQKGLRFPEKRLDLDGLGDPPGSG